MAHQAVHVARAPPLRYVQVGREAQRAAGRQVGQEGAARGRESLHCSKVGQEDGEKVGR